MNPFRYDFGYEWMYSYGHLVPMALGALLLVVALRFKWRRWLVATGAAVCLWGVVGLYIVQFALRINMPLELPTAGFMATGQRAVIDLGAGSGRASLMVLKARPQAHVVALDIFSDHYGIGANTPARLLKNAAIAGVADRLQAKSGDMRKLPFEEASFDAAVSAYAIDHMRRQDSIRAIQEVHRVLRPGGEFLLELMALDTYVRVAAPFAGAHGFFGPVNAEAGWRALLEQAQFEVVEAGRVPGTLYLLARKRA